MHTDDFQKEESGKRMTKVLRVRHSFGVPWNGFRTGHLRSILILILQKQWFDMIWSERTLRPLHVNLGKDKKKRKRKGKCDYQFGIFGKSLKGKKLASCYWDLKSKEKEKEKEIEILMRERKEKEVMEEHSPVHLNLMINCCDDPWKSQQLPWVMHPCLFHQGQGEKKQSNGANSITVLWASSFLNSKFHRQFSVNFRKCKRKSMVRKLILKQVNDFSGRK